MQIPLSQPDITSLEKNKVMEVLNSPYLSLGPRLLEFEKKFAGFMGTEYAVAVNSGTSALHLCIRALNIKEGDKVITTPFSFISSANCILFENAEPVFTDIDEKTLNIDTGKMGEKIEECRKKNDSLKAVLPVHVFGRPCEMNEIVSLAKEYGMHIIEDAAEATGAEYKAVNSWKKAGTFGDCGVFAFYPNKQMTTGEGGMIVTNDHKIYNLCRSMRNQGRGPSSAWFLHERLGFNYRISDISCALGIAQLERMEEILSKREKAARLYYDRLKDSNKWILPHLEEHKKISWFVYVIRLRNHFRRTDRDSILIKLRERGIGCSNYFSPIHLQPFYRKRFGYKKGDFPVTEKISERTIALPFYNNLKEEQIDYVCENLRNIAELL